MPKIPTPPATASAAEVYRLNPSLLAKLKAKLPPPLVDNTTSEHKAGFLLGIQYVLSIIEKDFTV